MLGRRILGWKRRGAVAAAAVALVGTGAIAAPFMQGAGADPTSVGGTFTYTMTSPTACGIAVVCAIGEFHGGIEGTFTNVITSLIPAPVLGVFFYSGAITIHSGGGNLNCGLAGALNFLSKDGEFGEICVINGGTGVFKGATGHLQLTGMSSAQLLFLGTHGGGDFGGKLIAPNLPPSN